MLLIDIQEKKYADKLVLKDAQVKIEEGATLGVLGHNGAGKSTLLNCIYQIEGYEGAITLGDRNIREIMDQSPATVSFVPDDMYIYPYLSGYDFVRFALEFRGLQFKDYEEKVVEAFKRFDMGESCFELANKYSLGMKRKTAIISQMVSEPKLMIFDEPTNGLDISSLASLNEWMKELNQKGCSIIVASHNLVFLNRATNHIYLLRFGHEAIELKDRTVAELERVYIESLESLHQPLN